MALRLFFPCLFSQAGLDLFAVGFVSILPLPFLWRFLKAVSKIAVTFWKCTDEHYCCRQREISFGIFGSYGFSLAQAKFANR